MYVTRKEGQSKKSIAQIMKIQSQSLLQIMKKKHAPPARGQSVVTGTNIHGRASVVSPVFKTRQNHNLDICVHASNGLRGVVHILMRTRHVVVPYKSGFRGWHVRFKL
jgi:hypothetical protein